ncbi:MAG: efflux RND transporter periplasmic adaptor subunit [Terrimicrobiaceae bacterium]|nr:efflux RND transporter periplasmic adaptor subunit [Terrimicrobiaceae bacterium]
MLRRRTGLSILIMAAILAVIIGGLVFYKVMQFRSFAGMKFKMPPIAVTSMKLGEQEWQPTLASVGTVQAVQGVTVSTDLPGIVEKITFDSGQQVKLGDPLVKLDTKQEEAQLNSGLARLQLAKSNLDRQQGLLQKRVSSQSDFDAAQAEFRQAEAAVAETKATIERKIIRAPFTGVLGIRQVNLGQYLQSGNAVVPLQSLDPIYVNFWLPQQRLQDLQPGGDVKVLADGLPGETFTGRITSVNAVVDEATRNVMVQATLENPGRKLRPGMFVNADVMLPMKEKVLAVPATAINYAPYGDSVFVIERMKDADGHAYDGVRQQVVKLGASQGDQVAVVSGLKPGEEVVTSGGFKLAPNAAIERNNTQQPANSTAPTPVDS